MSFFAGAFAACKAILVLLLASCAAAGPSAQQSTFEGTLLERASIPPPEEPFVQVFHQTPTDWRFGFITDGPMDQDAWGRVYEHVGYLAPYAIVNPRRNGNWRNRDQHLALAAARDLGRARGASIFALPETPEEEDLLREAYADRIGLAITHFFNDVEDYLGIPGGSGQWRAQDVGGGPNQLSTGYSAAFDTGVGEATKSFTISFGVAAGQNYFGGTPQILEMRTASGASWGIWFVNQGGQRGTNYFVFKTEKGAVLASPPMSGWLGPQWHEVLLTLDGSEGGDQVLVTLSVSGLEEVTGTFPRPEPGPRRLSLGGGASRKAVSIDDLTITGRVDGEARTLARYGFETPQAGGLAMTEVMDDSGNGHTLTASSGFEFLPTSGTDPELYHQLKRWLVDEMLAARAAASAPPPELVTNWRLSEQRHRLAAFRPAGFTHGNTVYYTGGLEWLFERSNKWVETQWAWEDGSPWSSAWIGHVNPDRAVLEPEAFRSLIVLAVLEGNRYFVVFTGMSNGHLGREGLSRTQAARVNAEVLYATATAASWFQSTSSTLAASRSLSDQPLVDRSEDDGLILRARQNDATGELWFAGLATGGPKQARMRLSGARGTLTNLATGEASGVTDEIVTLTLDGNAEPYHFAPAP